MPDPLPAAAGLFAAGIILTRFLPGGPWAALGAAAILVVAPAVPRLRQARAGALAGRLLPAAFLFAGAALAGFRLAPPPGDLAGLAGSGPVLVEARVPAGWSDGGPGRAVVARAVTSTSGRRPARGRVLLTFAGAPPPLRPGDIVVFRAELETPEPRDRFDYPAFLARQGIFVTARVTDRNLSITGAQPPARAARLLAAARARVDALLAARLADEPQLTMARALTFGLARPGPSLREDFRRAGAYHFLVISGLHTGFFILIVNALLAPLTAHPRTRALLLLPCLAAYALLCGLATPVVRAALMAAFYCLGVALDRAARAEHALCAAALVLLAVNPGDLFQPGWQLTFGVTLAIILGLRHLPARPLGLPRKIAAPLAATLLAQLVSIPLTAFHFGQVSVIGLLGNLVFIPLAGLSVFTALPGLLPGPPGALFAHAAWLCLTVFHRAAAGLAELPFAAFEVRPGNHLWHLGHLPLLVFLLTRTRPAQRLAARPAAVLSYREAPGHSRGL